MKRLAALVGALGLLPLSAHALTYTINVTGDAGVAPAFDPSLGTLTSVQVIETYAVGIAGQAILPSQIGTDFAPFEAHAYVSATEGNASAAFTTDGGASGGLMEAGSLGNPGTELATPANGGSVVFPVLYENLYFSAVYIQLPDFIQSATNTTIDFSFSFPSYQLVIGYELDQNPVSFPLVNTELVYDYVPEPAAWLLMTIGFGLSGAALRGRSRQFA